MYVHYTKNRQIRYLLYLLYSCFIGGKIVRKLTDGVIRSAKLLNYHLCSCAVEEKRTGVDLVAI